MNEGENNMKILSIDTSCKTAMAVVTENDKILAGIQLHDEKTHSVKLLPAIEYIMSAADVLPNQLDVIAVTNGPGSYTGLRIGVTTAKTYGYTLNIPVVGINSLEAIACSVDVEDDKIICPMIDARNERVYASVYKNGNEIIETKPLECAEFCNMLKEKYDNETLLFVGDGAEANSDMILELLDNSIIVSKEMICGSFVGLAKAANNCIAKAMKNNLHSEYGADKLKVEYFKEYNA